MTVQKLTKAQKQAIWVNTPPALIQRPLRRMRNAASDMIRLAKLDDATEETKHRAAVLGHLALSAKAFAEGGNGRLVKVVYKMAQL